MEIDLGKKQMNQNTLTWDKLNFPSTLNHVFVTYTAWRVHLPPSIPKPTHQITSPWITTSRGILFLLP